MARAVYVRCFGRDPEEKSISLYFQSLEHPLLSLSFVSVSRVPLFIREDSFRPLSQLRTECNHLECCDFNGVQMQLARFFFQSLNERLI